MYSIPSIRIDAALRALTACLIMSACGSSDPAEAGETKGHVRGHVRTTRGTPVAGAHVEARQQIVGGPSVMKVEGTTAADGSYDLELGTEVAPWLVVGSAAVTYNGQEVSFELIPDSDEPFTGHTGAVRDLTLDVRKSRFTAAVATTVIADPTPNEEIVVTLVPEGPIIDGSAGETIVGSPVSTADGWVVRGVPIGRYRVSAAHAGTPLLVSAPFTPSRPYAFQPSLVADFERTGPGIYRLEVDVCTPGPSSPRCVAAASIKRATPAR